MRIKTNLFAVAALFLSPTVTFAETRVATGDLVEVAVNETVEIDRHGVCRWVTNEHPELSFMVPTGTAEEWSSDDYAFLADSRDFARVEPCPAADMTQVCALGFGYVSSNWGVHPGDRVAVTLSGATNSRTAYTSSASYRGNIGSFCVLSDGMVLDSMSFSSSDGFSGDAAIRINGGPEVSQAPYKSGDKVEIVFTAPPSGAIVDFRLRVHDGEKFGAIQYLVGVSNGKPSSLSGSLPHTYGTSFASISGGSTVSSNAWTVPDLTMTAAEWYASSPSGSGVYDVLSTSLPFTSTLTAAAMVDGSFSYSAASAQVLRNGSAITSSTRIYPGDRLQLRLRAPSSGSGEMRYRMYVIENGGLGTPIGSRWTVSYQGSSTDSSFGSGSYFSGGSSSFFGSGSSFGGSFFGP